MVVKTVANKSKFKEYIIQNIDRQIDLEDIASALGLNFDELIKEMEAIVFSGTKLNIDYYINKILDEEQQQEIMDYCNEKLKRLEMYDNANGSFLIDTLLNYYMCGFNVQKTAQMMYVHRNSLQYRLKKIEEILEISLDDSMEYLYVVNCILVKRLMFN